MKCILYAELTLRNKHASVGRIEDTFMTGQTVRMQSYILMRGFKVKAHKSNKQKPEESQTNQRAETKAKRLESTPCHQKTAPILIVSFIIAFLLSHPK